MTEFYPALRLVHVGSVLLSITLFVVRGLLVLSGSALSESRLLRILPHVVDTVLLTSALMLASVIHQYPFVQSWLTTKVVLLVLYVVLGSIALRRGRSPAVRRLAFGAALLVVLFIVSIARAHDPLGLFAIRGDAATAVRYATTAQMQTQGQNLAAIRSHHLFAGLAPAQLQRIFASAHVDACEPGQVLFDRGQPARHFFVVLEGQVNLVLYSKAGEEKIVDILGPGHSFAEAVMFMEGPVYPVSAVAAGKSLVARFSNADYVAILRESPDTCLRMLGNLSQRLHMRIREIEYLTLESATHRLVRHLEGLLDPGQSPDPQQITLLESRQELASRLSMKPETLSRILRHLADAGTIVVHGRTLQVPDRKRLLAVLDATP